ncbi:MAG: hypothetical protein KGL39_00265 [Patescibacteria group bacterium]|nr:hypothetical protein [Patescibacteria group bacterium]
MEKIHGMSAHISWKDGHLQFSSGGVSGEAFRALFDAPALSAKLMEHVGEGQSAILYGEAYGGKCMKMSDTYGPNLRFIVFEVKIGDV